MQEGSERTSEGESEEHDDDEDPDNTERELADFEAFLEQVV